MSSFTERAVNIPESIQDADFLGAGLSAWVYQLDAVAKCYSENDFDYRGREIAVYKRLTAPDTECPDTIVRFYGVLDGRVLLLQFARHGSIRQYYANPHPDTPLHTRLRWAEQITGAIIFLHSRGVFHGDLSCNNVFLDEGLNAKLGDFASSSIEGSPFEPLYEDGHFLPDESADPVTHEIFALGSVFYEIMTGSRPYDSITAIGSHEIKNLFSQGRFPDLEQVPALGTVISKCWNRQYDTVEDVLQDIKQEHDRLSCIASKQKHTRSFPVQGPLILALVTVLPIVWLVRHRK